MSAGIDSGSSAQASPTGRGPGRLAIARKRVTARGARQWYFGAAFGLIYQIIMVATIWTSPLPLWSMVTATILLLPLWAGFSFLPPIFWESGRSLRVAVVLAYFAYTLVFLPFLGANALWEWSLVGAIAATLWEEWWLVVSAAIVLIGIQAAYAIATGFSDSIGISAFVTFSVMATMFGINRQISGMRQLRAAQSEVARLAVVEERNRFSRDMHDVLGHSLTVVTVKSELARRLVSIDPVKAEAEIADIERLSRAALTDLRAAVAGYREINLSTELGAAQAALAAADVTVELPASADVAAPDLRELFGWVLREGITNVIRHSEARNCWVEVTRTQLTIADDGHGSDCSSDGTGGDRGDAATTVGGGNGLIGLAERARAAGAELLTGRSKQGGFLLTVRRAGT